MSTPTFARMFDVFGPTSDFRSPMWTIRLCPLISLLCIVLAETVWQTGFAHGICLGLATGQLVVLSIATFQITGLTYRNAEQPSDVQNLSITR
jgi:hypothetical protein